MLAEQGIATRVVSMPSTNVFDRQSAAYQDAVLPLNLPTVAIEAAHPDFWRKYVGRTGTVVGMPTFGESAPAKDLYAHFGITAQRVVESVRNLVGGSMSTAHNHSYDLVMFDLDGTLVETAPEIMDATNDTLRHFELAEVTQAQINAWIGHGTRELLISALAYAQQVLSHEY